MIGIGDCFFLCFFRFSCVQSYDTGAIEELSGILDEEIFKKPPGCEPGLKMVLWFLCFSVSFSLFLSQKEIGRSRIRWICLFLTSRHRCEHHHSAVIWILAR